MGLMASGAAWAANQAQRAARATAKASTAKQASKATAKAANAVPMGANGSTTGQVKAGVKAGNEVVADSGWSSIAEGAEATENAMTATSDVASVAVPASVAGYSLYNASQYEPPELTSTRQATPAAMGDTPEEAKISIGSDNEEDTDSRSSGRDSLMTTSTMPEQTAPAPTQTTGVRV